MKRGCRTADLVLTCSCCGWCSTASSPGRSCSAGAGPSLVPALDRRRPVPPRLRAPKAALLLLVAVPRRYRAFERRGGPHRARRRRRRDRSGFLDIPLDCATRTASRCSPASSRRRRVPCGPSWRSDRAALTLHVLDLRDEQRWIDTIKRRYETADGDLRMSALLAGDRFAQMCCLPGHGLCGRPAAARPDARRTACWRSTRSTSAR